MKTPDEIKKSFRIHSLNKRNGCIGCAYRDPNKISFKCQGELFKDLRVYIKQLEAERDAAVSELIGCCNVCRWEDSEKCAYCHFNEEAWNVHESNWEWRGVQKEE